MQFRDLFAMGQAYARPLILRPVVQTLENDEYPFQELIFDADAIIPEGELPLSVLLCHVNIHFRRLILAAELDGIADEVLEQQL